jgi:2-dehydrotetronate isomerase
MTTPSITANISFMFAEHPFLDCIDTAKAAGFDRVDHPVEQLRERLDRAGVRLTGLNTVPGDAPGAWGRAGVLGEEAAFRTSPSSASMSSRPSRSIQRLTME